MVPPYDMGYGMGYGNMGYGYNQPDQQMMWHQPTEQMVCNTPCTNGAALARATIVVHGPPHPHRSRPWGPPSENALAAEDIEVTKEVNSGGPPRGVGVC